MKEESMNLVGKTIESLEEHYHYFGCIYKDCGDVSGTLLVFKFTDGTTAVRRSICRDNGDGSSSVLDEWFSSFKEAVDPNQFEDVDDDIGDDLFDEDEDED